MTTLGAPDEAASAQTRIVAEIWGMKLFEYEDVVGVNDEGEATVHQPWVLSLTPGRIHWKVAD